MTDHPIIFSAPMVLALLDGRKTMTRRLAWKFSDVNDNHTKSPSPWQRVQPGDRLWVRESLKRVGAPHHGWSYAADGSMVSLPHSDPRVSAMIAWAHHKEGDNAPSIHMPRWASRLTLIVTVTKIERLQNIGPADAKAEGLEWVGRTWGVSGITSSWWAMPTEAFAALWEHLHGAEAWDENPEVVALSFTVHKQNIDAMAEAA